MKRIFYFLPIVLLAIISCKKENQLPESTICILPVPSDTVEVALTKDNIRGPWKMYASLSGDVAPVWIYNNDESGLTFANDSVYYMGQPKELARPYFLSSFHKPELLRDYGGVTLLKIVAANNVDTIYHHLTMYKKRFELQQVNCEGCFSMYIRYEK